MGCIMPQIIVERAAGSLADRFRSYCVIIDGQVRGNIRQKEKWSFEVAAGSHTVSFRIDYYSSCPVKVAVANRTRLVCKSSLAHALGLLALFSPQSWITVHEDDAVATGDLPYPGDVNWQQLAKKPARLAGANVRVKNARPGALRLSDSNMDEDTRAWRTLELDLREAVTAGNLEIRYDPQVDIAKNRVVAFVASLQWHHPVLGKVPEADFMPMAETLGLSGIIGKKVLDASCNEAANWPDNVSVAVTVSAGLIEDGALSAIVASALRSSGLAPHRLILEVAESVVLGTTAAQLVELQAVRLIGVRISMNDFGIIPACLRRDIEGVFDVVKISSLLVRGLSQSNDHLTKALEAIKFCAIHRVPCCAVGVESREDLAVLADEQCALAQGQLFGSSLAAREVLGYLARNSVGIGPGAADPESLFRNIAELTNDVVLVVTAPSENVDSRITFVNQAFTYLTGYDAAEMIGSNATEFYRDQKGDKAAQALRATLAQGRSAREHVLFQTKSGPPCWLDMCVAPYRGPDGRISHFIAISCETSSRLNGPGEAVTAGQRDEVSAC